MRGSFFQQSNNAGALSYVYYEGEPGRRSAGKATHQSRGAADCGEYRQAAGAVAAQVNVTGGGQLLVY
jgi:hypothetical protein